MNNFHPESLLAVAKQKTQEEVDQRLAWKLSHGFSVRRWLVALGVWMVVSGEKLQTRYSIPAQTNQISFPQHKARKIGA